MSNTEYPVVKKKETCAGQMYCDGKRQLVLSLVGYL